MTLLLHQSSHLKRNVSCCCPAKEHLSSMSRWFQIILKALSKLINLFVRQFCDSSYWWAYIAALKAHHLSERNFLYNGVATTEAANYMEHWCHLVLIITPFGWSQNEQSFRIFAFYWAFFLCHIFVYPKTTKHIAVIKVFACACLCVSLHTEYKIPNHQS